jgi:hypothetical protein
MKVCNNTLELDSLETQLTGWDQDLRLGHRGVEQLTIFLQEVQRQLQGHAQSPEDPAAEDSDVDPVRFHSREHLEMAIDPMTLAKFRQQATWYLLLVPALLKLIDQCEAALHPDDVAGLIKREAAREFPCGRF